jgi:type II secretory pathway component PulF
MTSFYYRGITNSGNDVAGEIEAESSRAARDQLRERSIFVSDIYPKSGRDILQFYGRYREKVSLFSRELSILLKSGISLAQALVVLIEECEDKKFRNILIGIKDSIQSGSTFADSLARYSDVFDELYVNTVRSGEASGTLDIVLGRLSKSLQNDVRLRQRLSAALTYPIVMAITACAVLVFLLTFVVPQITAILIEQHKVLPTITRILVLISTIVKSYGLVALAILFISAIFARRIFSLNKVRSAVDKLAISLPFLRGLIIKRIILRFSDTLALLLESGVPVMEALAITKGIINNKYVEKLLEVAIQRVAEGDSLGTALKASHIFPPMVSYMISVGEESGELPSLLRDASEIYQEGLEVEMQRLCSLIEPILILTMALVVGFIVLSILLPILEISKL